MAVSTSRFLCLILAVLIAVGMSNSGQRVEAQTCNTDIMDLVGNCRKFVGKSGSKVSPSSGCCNLVKDFDVPCLCSLLTQEIEDIISMDKVVYVAVAKRFQQEQNVEVIRFQQLDVKDYEIRMMLLII